MHKGNAPKRLELGWNWKSHDWFKSNGHVKWENANERMLPSGGWSMFCQFDQKQRWPWLATKGATLSSCILIHHNLPATNPGWVEMSVDINGLLLHLERLHPSYNALHWPPTLNLKTKHFSRSWSLKKKLARICCLKISYLRKTEKQTYCWLQESFIFFKDFRGRDLKFCTFILGLKQPPLS